MKAARYLTVVSAVLFPFAVALLFGGAGCNGCKKDETEPVPTAAPTPTPTPTPPATITPEEDAGSDAADAADGDADAAKPTGGGDPTGIKKCCSALRQNARSAPPDQQSGYLTAASACDAIAASSQSRQALAGLRAFLKGAQMPSQCQ
jgi:hypothetical protein